jgi:hypothetical protein
MKRLILALLILLGAHTSFSQTICPPEGNAKTEKKKESNVLKNRPVDIKLNPKTLSIDSLLLDGNDYNRFSNSDYVIVTGYVIGIKGGGLESCNCKSKNEADHDIHIYIGKTPNSEKQDCFIVEITPKFKSLNKIDYQKLIGRKVTVTGYLFFDEEHKGNARNTCKKCTKLWRKTVWEVHPVVKIEEVQ